MLKYLLLIALLLILTIVLTTRYDKRDFRYQADLVAIEGSTSVATLLLDIQKAFSEKYPDIPLSFTFTSSHDGLLSIQKKTTDIAVCSFIDNDKLSKLNQSKLKTLILGQDKIAIIVNKNNEIKQIDLNELRELFMGSKTLARKFNLYLRSDNSGTYKFIEQKFNLKNSNSSKAIYVSDSSQIIQSIAKDKKGIGFISSSLLTKGDSVKCIELIDKNTAIELLRPIYLIYDSDAKPNTLKFIEFCSSQVKPILIKNHLQLINDTN